MEHESAVLYLTGFAARVRLRTFLHRLMALDAVYSPSEVIERRDEIVAVIEALQRHGRLNAHDYCRNRAGIAPGVTATQDQADKGQLVAVALEVVDRVARGDYDLEDMGESLNLFIMQFWRFV